jgi:hypothetical protein
VSIAPAHVPSKPRIEQFVDAMFLEDVRRDERQLLNGLSEFRGHASRSNGYEANSGDGGRNLQMAVVGSIAWRQAFLENEVNFPRPC